MNLFARIPMKYLFFNINLYSDLSIFDFSYSFLTSALTVLTLRQKCPYTGHPSVFSPNAGKCGPENSSIPTLFTQ